MNLENNRFRLALPCSVYLYSVTRRSLISDYHNHIYFHVCTNSISMHKMNFIKKKNKEEERKDEEKIEELHQDPF